MNARIDPTGTLTLVLTNSPPTAPEPFAPRPTGLLETFDSLEGWLMLSHGNPGELGKIEPLQILGGPLAIAVFSTMETLERFRAQFPDLAVCTARIVKITDTDLFLEDVPQDVCVALDLRRTETGTVKYFDVSTMREGT